MADGDTAMVCGEERWSDGTRTRTVIRLCVDTKWGAYVAETEAVREPPDDAQLFIASRIFRL